MKKLCTYRWTREVAASEFGLNPRTVTKRIKQAGLRAGDDGCFSTRDIAAALFGDYEGERVRKMRAEADLLEMDRDEKLRRLLPAEAVGRVWEGIVVGARAVIGRMRISESERVAALTELRSLDVDDYFATPGAEVTDAT